MKQRHRIQVLGLSCAALVLGATSVASAACDVQPDELRIVAFSSSHADASGPTTTGKDLLVVENVSTRALSLDDCELTTASTGVVLNFPDATLIRRPNPSPGAATEIEPGKHALVLFNRSSDYPQNYYEGVLAGKYAVDDDVVVYVPTDTNPHTAYIGNSLITLSSPDGVFVSVAYGDAPDSADGQNPRIAAAAGGSGFFVPRNQNVIADDALYYDGNFWTELDIPDYSGGEIPADSIWPAPLAFPLLAEVICGDNVTEGTEVCDGQEGCDTDCTPLEHWVCAEDNAQVVVCETEPGWTCEAGDPTDCKTTCGDGITADVETCDDGNTDAGDGCSATCTVEDGYTCTGTPSVCTDDSVPPPVPVCGDAKVDTGEACDDGNTTAGDGCSATCTVESGWACTGNPSVCTENSSPALCGDDVVQSGEECDGQAGCRKDCTWNIATTGGRVGSCSTGLGEGLGGGLAMLALACGLVLNRRRKNAA